MIALRLIIRGSRQVDPEGGYVPAWRTVDIPITEDQMEWINHQRELVSGDIQGVEIVPLEDWATLPKEK
jgi:hypothetical protein